MTDTEYENAIKDVCSRINELEQLIYKGNGKPALIVQISELQHQVATLSENFDSRFASLSETLNMKFANMNAILKNYDDNVNNVKQELEDHIDKTEDYKAQVSNNKTAVIVAVIACIGAILSNVVAVSFAR